MNRTITNEIQKLNYNPAEILAFYGEQFSEVVPVEDKMDEDSYVVMRHEKETAEKPNFDIAVVNAMNDRTYPGALLLANEQLVNNMPTALYARRAPLRLHINLPGLKEDGSSVVENPKNSTVSEAIDKIVSLWFDKHAATEEVPTNFSYTESRIYSKAHLQVIAGFDLSSDLHLDFKAVDDDEKHIFLLTFKQIFYTVSVDTPDEPGDFFAEDETWENLTNNGVNNANPPVYVKNVAYGRTIYVAMQTTNKSSDYEVKLNGAIDDNKLNASVFAESIFEDTEYSVVVLGGDPSEHIHTVTKDFGEIEKIITGNAEFSRKNPGSPVAYCTTFLKNNVVGVINSSTDYIKTVSTRYKSVTLNLNHTGGYVAKFDISWKTHRYENGEEVLSSATDWENNGDHYSAPFSTPITLPKNATAIHVKAREQTGLAWEGWRTILDKEVETYPNINVHIYGTTLNQKYEISYSE